MSLLTIITDPEMGAAVLCGLANPTSVVGSNDPNVPMLLRLANQEGRSLARRHDWASLIVSVTELTLATQAQTAFFSDFDRFVPYVEIWNRSLNMKYSGPTSPRDRQRLLSSGLTAGSPGWWWVEGLTLQIYPAPTAGETLAYEMISNLWVTTDAIFTDFRTHFAADTDIALIPEDLITLGIVWRYKKAKGFDYAEDLSTYEREVELRCSRDRGGPRIMELSSRGGDILEPSWPGTITP